MIYNTRLVQGHLLQHCLFQAQHCQCFKGRDTSHLAGPVAEINHLQPLSRSMAWEVLGPIHALLGPIVVPALESKSAYLAYMGQKWGDKEAS